MDERWVPVLVLTPIGIVVIAYLFAWRSKSTRLRKSGKALLAIVVGFVALFSSWWALGMTIGIWGLDGSPYGPHSVKEVLAALALQAIVLLFPFGTLYFCVRFAKGAAKPANEPR